MSFCRLKVLFFATFKQSIKTGYLRFSTITKEKMSKRISLPLSLLLYCYISLSQNIVTDTSATCVAYWQKGDVKNLHITKMSRTLESGIQKSFNRHSYGATISILDASDTSYTIEWL